jgi:hypothetical protein
MADKGDAGFADSRKQETTAFESPSV